ncbi:TPA: DUF551 domain-containing protein [Citrobacter koseri]
MIDKYRLDDLRLESGEKGELARWVIQLQRDLDSERRKAGNSPVIPDRWIPVSERMPEKADEVLCAKEFDGPGDWSRKVGYYLAGKWTVYGASWTPTHWMPLPAAPQQEVKQALAKGTECYGDSMQELAKKEVK